MNRRDDVAANREETPCAALMESASGASGSGAGSDRSAATTEVEMNDPLHNALVAIFEAIAEREEKSIDEVVAEFVEGYERG